MIKAWKVYWEDPQCGRRLSYKASRRDADHRLCRARKEAREVHGKKVSIDPSGIQPVNLPTEKFPLIDLLNELERTVHEGYRITKN